jgi:nitrite reductase (NADH) small subunit
MTFVDAGLLDSIPRRGARVLRIDDRSIALFRTTDDRVYALEDRCPHRGGPLSQGIVHGHCVTCPLHDWIIDLESGEATGPDEGASARFDVRIEDGRIFVCSAPPSEGTPLERDANDAAEPLPAAKVTAGA